LDALAAKGPTPLIRSARRRLFQMLAPQRGPKAEELERECAAGQESAGGAPYTPGELFCAGDCVFFVSFGARAAVGLSAGIIYSIETAEPLARLERFCRDVRETLLSINADAAKEDRASDRADASDHGRASTDDTAPVDKTAHVEIVTDDATGGSSVESSALPAWEPRGVSSSQGLARFIAIQPTDFAVVARCKGGARGYVRATELMESREVRAFLRRVQEMRREGYSARRLFAEADALGVPLERLAEAGLLEREVRVSCRKSGHALFDLPTADSLAAITISKAKCSLCAAPVVDEVVEETINPTWLAVALLEDGWWLANRVHQIVRALGVPESEIASGPASTHGESYLAAEVCGTSFLFVTRDGDLTPAFARRVSETVAQTEAAHLVAVVTGAVEDEGRLRLYEFAWRRARDGHDLDITLAEGLDAAHAEIERAFERAIRRELSRRLYALDSPLGFGASDFVLDWFRLAKPSVAANAALAPRFARLDQRVAS
ncbi:MAG: hypothetical protein M3268_01010, partial [Acidobacteriota bacterium]|nr:hypothetical protein [Acidobacteriota bacterium]